MTGISSRKREERNQSSSVTMNMLVKVCLFLMAAVALTHHNQVSAQIDCAGMNALSECMRPGDTTNATGQFICRRRYNPGLGQVTHQTLCIATSWGSSSDRCGCCATGCPTSCSELCPFAPGQGPPYGRWVYDWESITPYRMCVTPGRSLQLQQQNGNRWRCRQRNNWFSRTFYGEEPKWNSKGTADFWP
ncbi:expressed unknown protein [Seminavis robusta]|uniref:Uncharacterized protein n=1 Tax=Seminavis robusta TaxID=568900 RepID=A0A9N8DY77_9STRA|nr:expressed unknown protein [Seminavis robusta]|eukprot:Sro446_g144710.1 n/a (190) ;mRNA; r:46010-47360